MSDRNDQSSIKIISSFEDLISIFRQCNHTISVLHQYSSDDFMALNNCIRNFHEQATAILQSLSGMENMDFVQENESLTQARLASSNISHIVTKLQFHDIIRQKLEHVQDTNGLIIEELLLNISKDPSRQENKYIPVISDIIRLHTAQLIDTNNTYQQAFAEIRIDLQSIKEANDTIAESRLNYKIAGSKTNKSISLESIKNLSKKLSAQVADSIATIKYCEDFDALVKEITQLLAAIQVKLPLSSIKDNTAGYYTETLQSLEQLYTMESERIIFNQVVKGGELPTTHLNQEKDNSGNIELF